MINNLAKKLVNKNETEIEDILYQTFRPEDSEKEKKGEKKLKRPTKSSMKKQRK